MFRRFSRSLMMQAGTMPPRVMTSIVGLPATPEALQLDMPLQVRFEPRGDVSLPVFGPAR